MSVDVGLDRTSSGQDVTVFMAPQTDETTEVKPAAGDFITPAGAVALSQVPIAVESRERQGRSYDAPAQLTAGVGKGDGSFPTYVKPTGNAGTPPEIGPLLESLFGHETINPGFDAGAGVPVLTTDGGGSGATITSITVNTAGQITAVDWNVAGTGYAVGDTITFTQGTATATYTLATGDVTAGVLQDLTGVVIGPIRSVVYTLRSPDDDRNFYTLWRLLGTTLRRAVGAYVGSATFRIGATRDAEGFVLADWTLGCYSLLKTPTDSNTVAITRVFDATGDAPTVTTDGDGAGAVVNNITVDAQGRITAVTWTSGGTGYATGDEITFTQGTVRASYTLMAANHTGGVLNALAGLTLTPVADTIPVNQIAEFAVGQFVTFDSGDLDNAGVGYEITAVETADSRIIISPAITQDVADGRLIQPWTPDGTRVGDELGGRIGVTNWGTEFTGLKIISAEIPVDLQVADVPGQQGDGQYVTGLEYGRRQITWSLTVLHRPDYEAMQSHILLETENDLTFTVGDTSGERVTFLLRNAKILTAEEIDGEPMQMRFTGTARATAARNDVLQLSFT